MPIATGCSALAPRRVWPGRTRRPPSTEPEPNPSHRTVRSISVRRCWRTPTVSSTRCSPRSAAPALRQAGGGVPALVALLSAAGEVLRACESSVRSGVAPRAGDLSGVDLRA